VTGLLLYFRTILLQSANIPAQNFSDVMVC